MVGRRQLAIELGFILCIVSCSSGRYSPWAVGNEYVYRMRTVSTNDIPGLGSQAAGVKIKCRLVVQCRDSATIVVKLVDITSWQFQDDVKEVWEAIDAARPLGTQVVLEGKHFLERQFIIRHREGMFKSLSLSEEEPLWSINMKKAIASKLQLHVSGSRSFEFASRNFDRLTDDPVADVNAVFTVYEDGVTGECETVYEIAPLSEALIRSDSKLNPVPQLCVEETFFQVIKTKDYSRCRSKQPFFNVIAPSGWNCRPEASTCDTALSRSSVNRYIACGSLESFTLLKMTHQSEVRVNPYAYDTEQLRSISLMKLTLQAVRPAYHALGAGRRYLNKDYYDAGPVITSLVFTFSGTNAAGVVWNENDYLKRPSMHDTDHLEAAEMRPDITHLLAKAVDQIEANQEAAIDSIASLSQLMRQYNYSELLTAVGDLDKRTSDERSVILDAIMAAGTNPSILFLKEAILQGRLSRTESIQAIAGLPLHVRTPSHEVLNELHDMTIQVQKSADRSVYHAALFSMSQLIHIACINVTEARTRFPAVLYGSFCQTENSSFINKLVLLLHKEVYSSTLLEDKMVALSGLGEIGHESVIPTLFSVIKAKETYSTLVRTRAVVSLHKLAHNSNERVIRILSTIHHDASECTEVRIAAFTLMILANPPAYMLQRIAVSSWFEQNTHIGSFVYTTFASLASNVRPLGNMNEMSQKAQIMLPLVKRVPVGLRYSQSFKWSHLLPERNAGAEFHHELLKSIDSLIPKSIYSRLSWALGPHHFDVFEMEMYGDLKGLWDDFLAMMRSFLGDSSIQDSDLHPDLRRMKKQLSEKKLLPVHKTGSAQGFAHLNFMKSIHRFKSIGGDNVLSFFQGLLKRSEDESQSKFSYQKWTPLAHAEMLMPNTLGFLVQIQVQADLLAVAKGKAQMRTGGLSKFADLKEVDNEYSRRSLGLAVELKPAMVFKLRSSMKTNVEFAQAVTLSGVDTCVSLNLPGHYSIGYDRDNMKLALAWKSVSSAGPTSLFHYSVRPITSLRNSYRSDFRFTVTDDIKGVAADGVTPQRYESFIGRKTGLQLEYSIYSETPINAESSNGQSLSDLLTNLNFAILPASLHKRSYRVTLDPSKSEKDVILLLFKFDMANTFKNGALVVNAESKAQVVLENFDQPIQFSPYTEPPTKLKLTKILSCISSGMGLHVETKFILKSKSGSATTYKSAISGAFDSEGSKLAISARLELPNDQNNTDVFTVCFDAAGQYPRVSSLNRYDVIEIAPKANWNATLGFGDMCQHQLTFEVDMKRSDAFSSYVLNSSENRECALHESRGEYNHEQCRAVRQLATMFDEYAANVKYDQLPPVFVNAANGLETWLRSKLNAYLLEDYVEVKNSERELKVSLKVHPSLSTFDLMIFKTESNVFFRGVALSEMANLFFPLHAESFTGVVDNQENDQLTLECRVESNIITAFNQVQYNVSVNDLEHIIVAVPGIDSFALFIRRETNQTILTLLVHHGKLEILPADLKILYNGMEVLLNEDQPIEIYHTHQSSHSQGSSIGAYKVGPTAFKITAHYHDFHIFIDASSGIIVKAPRSLQGKMMGLCGNARLKNDQRCGLSSYRINATEKQCTPEEERKRPREEEAAYQLKQESGKNTTIRNATNVDCFVRRTMVLHRDDAKCFSITAVRECRPHCQGRSLRAFQIGFHCVPHSMAADELAHEAKFDELTFVYGKKEDIRTTRYLPTVCQPMTGQPDTTVA